MASSSQADGVRTSAAAGPGSGSGSGPGPGPGPGPEPGSRYGCGCGADVGSRDRLRTPTQDSSPAYPVERTAVTRGTEGDGGRVGDGGSEGVGGRGGRRPWGDRCVRRRWGTAGRDERRVGAEAGGARGGSEASRPRQAAGRRQRLPTRGQVSPAGRTVPAEDRAGGAYAGYAGQEARTPGTPERSPGRSPGGTPACGRSHPPRTHLARPEARRQNCPGRSRTQVLAARRSSGEAAGASSGWRAAQRTT